MSWDTAELAVLRGRSSLEVVRTDGSAVASLDLDDEHRLEPPVAWSEDGGALFFATFGTLMRAEPGGVPDAVYEPRGGYHLIVGASVVSLDEELLVLEDVYHGAGYWPESHGLARVDPATGEATYVDGKLTYFDVARHEETALIEACGRPDAGDVTAVEAVETFALDLKTFERRSVAANDPVLGDGPPSWSPSGDRVVYSTLEGLVVESVAGAELARLEGDELRYPVWSPVDERIVYARNETELAVWDLESSVSNSVGHFDAEFRVTWSPNGLHLAVRELTGGRPDLFAACWPDRFDRSESRVHVLSDLGAPASITSVAWERPPAWSRDSRYLGVVSGSRLVLFDANTGQTTQLPEFVDAFAWRP